MYFDAGVGRGSLVCLFCVLVSVEKWSACGMSRERFVFLYYWSFLDLTCCHMSSFVFVVIFMPFSLRYYPFNDLFI